MTTYFGKLNKFEGHDFRRWQKKMHFLLTTLKVVYVLTTPMPELLDDATMEVIRIRAKWENDDYICRGHILNEDSSSKKFLTGHFKRDFRSGNKKNANAGGSEKGSKDHSQDQGQNFVPVWNSVVKYFVSLISEAFYVQDDAIAWWIDSSATTHVCKDRFWFKTNKPVKDGSVLYMGDDHFTHVYGKGSVMLDLEAIHNLVIHQMDVKTAFLNGDLEEEVCMKQPKEFVMPGNEHKMCKLVKSLYGLKQAPKHWHQKFDEVVLSSSFHLNQSDKCVYSKFDDSDCSPVSTPMDPVEKLKPNTGKPVDQLEYSRAIGCLMYVMTSIRPDNAYVVGRLSRFTSNPSRQHWKAITRLFKYLRGTMNYGLSYVRYPSLLEAYSHASWINHVEDLSSTSGWVFLLGGGAILWASKKQTCITGSTMKSEFVALAATGKEAEWLRNLIHEISI
nr:zinc finger, CCHC-type [Tanacetum cinerariifolium]